MTKEEAIAWWVIVLIQALAVSHLVYYWEDFKRLFTKNHQLPPSTTSQEEFDRQYDSLPGERNEALERMILSESATTTSVIPLNLTDSYNTPASIKEEEKPKKKRGRPKKNSINKEVPS